MIVYSHHNEKVAFMKNEFTRVFRAFSDAKRVQILEMLGNGEQCACVLLEDMEISQSTLSHHMKILCESGIVKSRRVGKWSYYSIDEEGCKYGNRLLNAVVERKMGSIQQEAKANYARPILHRILLSRSKQDSVGCCTRRA